MSDAGSTFPRVASLLADATGAAVVRSRPVGGGSINDAHRVDLDDGRSVFVKLRPGAPPGWFVVEARGLDWLRDGLLGAGAVGRGVRVPEVVAVGDDDGRRFLALEWIEPGAPGAGHDARLGRGLAALHRSGAPGWGLDHGNLVGSLQVSNEPCATWPEFWVERRIRPIARRARDEGRMPAALARAVERLAARVPELAGPPEAPARLHGDLWAGNAIAGADGAAWLVDPAVYGGHREVDLAMMRLFGGFDARCFAAYEEVAPLAAGAPDRVQLWQVVPLLVHVVLFGGGYVAALEKAVGRYVPTSG